MLKKSFRLISPLLIFSLIGCMGEKENSSSDLGISSPVKLESSDTTVILLEDYFLNKSEVVGVNLPEAWSSSFSNQKDSLLIFSQNTRGKLFNLEFITETGNMDVLCLGSIKEPVSVILKDKNYENVQLKGEMTNWNLVDGQLADGNWSFEFLLNPNAYQYVFVADGKELLDPVNSLQADNGSGGVNSLLDLRPSKEEEAAFPILQTQSFEENRVSFDIKGEAENLICFPYLDNELLDYSVENGVLSIDLPGNKGRSKLRIFAYNKAGVSNDIMVPILDGQVLTDPQVLGRTDYESQVMYFTLVDRFYNGNSENDAPLDDDRLYDKANYQGGDLAGITEKIKSGYFDELGINSIWLSPITQNPAGAFQEYIEPQNFYSGYHGYWPISSSTIDHRFGSDDEMFELVKTAHEHDIAILLDYVCNHVHEQHPIIKNNPEYATVFELEDGRKNLRLWDEQRLTTWFDEFLPSLDLENPEVVDLQVDSTMFWIEKFDFDGFRHDATKHIPLDFWRKLTRKLKEERVSKGKKVYQIGETYGSRDLVNSYIGSGLLDAQFDFNLYFDSRSSFAFQEPSMQVVADALKQSLTYYGHHNTMGYMTGNHDQPRFISYAGGALSMDEDPRAAGFEREVGVGDPIGYRKLQMMTAFYLSIPGVPTIFYGDEIGIPGANDPDNRDMMIFEDLDPKQAETKAMTSKMINLRRQSMSLIYGDTRIVESSESHIILERRYFDEVSYCVFNKDIRTKTFSIKTDNKTNSMTFVRKISEADKLIKNEAQLTLSVEPWSFEIIQSK
jgi:cyclomaltodextrinase